MQENHVHAVLETEKLAVADAVCDSVALAVLLREKLAVADALAVGVAQYMFWPLAQKKIVAAPSFEFWAGAPTTMLIPSPSCRAMLPPKAAYELS